MENADELNEMISALALGVYLDTLGNVGLRLGANETAGSVIDQDEARQILQSAFSKNLAPARGPMPAVFERGALESDFLDSFYPSPI